jgi:hypothetical protein
MRIFPHLCYHTSLPNPTASVAIMFVLLAYCKVCCITGHKGPEGEYKYSFTLDLRDGGLLLSAGN